MCGGRGEREKYYPNVRSNNISSTHSVSLSPSLSFSCTHAHTHTHTHIHKNTHAHKLPQALLPLGSLSSDVCGQGRQEQVLARGAKSYPSVRSHNISLFLRLSLSHTHTHTHTHTLTHTLTHTHIIAGAATAGGLGCVGAGARGASAARACDQGFLYVCHLNIFANESRALWNVSAVVSIV